MGILHVLVPLQIAFLALDVPLLKDSGVGWKLWLKIWCVYGLIEAALYCVVPQYKGGDLSWSAWLPLSFLVFSFFDYMVHRFIGHSRLLWFLHENHHLPQRVNLAMPGITLRPYSAITMGLILAGTACVSNSLDQLIGSSILRGLTPALLISGTVGILVHSQWFSSRFPNPAFMRGLLLVTPQEHALHHSRNHRGNYGNFTLIWDRLFGTYVPLESSLPVEIGYPSTRDYLQSVSFGILSCQPTQLRSPCGSHAPHDEACP